MHHGPSNLDASYLRNGALVCSGVSLYQIVTQSFRNSLRDLETYVISIGLLRVLQEQFKIHYVHVLPEHSEGALETAEWKIPLIFFGMGI